MATDEELENQLMLSKVEEFNMGYVRFNLLDPICGANAWGSINHRALEPKIVSVLIWKSVYCIREQRLIRTKVKKMVDDFGGGVGQLNAQSDKALKLAVRPDWISCTPVATINGLYILEIPTLDLTQMGEEANERNQLKPLSGNHRRAAVVEFNAQLEKRLNALNEEIEKLDDADFTPESQAAIAELKAQETKLLRRIECSQWWGVQLFDLSK